MCVCNAREPSLPVVKMRGLPYSAKDEDIRQFFGADVKIGQSSQLVCLR